MTDGFSTRDHDMSQPSLCSGSWGLCPREARGRNGRGTYLWGNWVEYVLLLRLHRFGDGRVDDKSSYVAASADLEAMSRLIWLERQFREASSTIKSHGRR